MKMFTRTIEEVRDLQIFEFADSYPMMSEDETLELAQNIEENGLVHSIVVWDNKLLDGRNRLKALLKTNLVEVLVSEFEGTENEAVEFIRSCNDVRRHMDTGQRAFVALAYKKYVSIELEEKMLAGVGDPGVGSRQGSDQKKRAPKASEIAAERYSIGQSAVEIANKLATSPIATDLVESVKRGEKAGGITLNKANEIFKERTEDFETKLAYIKQFPEVMEMYRNGTPLNEARQEAKRIEAFQKESRRAIINIGLDDYRTLMETFEFGSETVNNTIKNFVKIEELNELISLTEDVISKANTTKKAANLRREEIHGA